MDKNVKLIIYFYSKGYKDILYIIVLRNVK